MALYKEKIIEHYQNPQHSERPNNFTHTAKVENLSCGDAATVFLTIEKEVITSMHHVSEGCALTVATASLLSESLQGKSISEVQALTLPYLEQLLEMEVSDARQSCVLIPLQAVQTALKHSTI